MKRIAHLINIYTDEVFNPHPPGALFKHVTSFTDHGR